MGKSGFFFMMVFQWCWILNEFFYGAKITFVGDCAKILLIYILEFRLCWVLSQVLLLFWNTNSHQKAVLSTD